VADPVEQSLRSAQRTDAAVAPMPGVLVSLATVEGADVVGGQTLAVIESMKMQTDIRAPRDGRVARVLVAVGDTFGQGAPLIALVPDQDEEEEE
jgi:3-methylcrotonyl-CoA carboxylase alpha subunit